MNKLRIAIVCDGVNKFVAGSSNSSIHFSELLSKRGHKVIIISSGSSKTLEINTHKRIKIYCLPGFPVPKSNKTLYFAYPNSKIVMDILKEERINIVHFMLPTPLSFSAISAANKLHLRIIGHSHTQPENWIAQVPWVFDVIKKVIVSWGYKFLIRVYSKADAIICPSEFCEKLLKSNGLKKKTYVISNGVNTSVFKIQDSKRYAKDYSLSAETKKILFVGRLEPEKNVSLLIKSLKYVKRRFKNFEVCIVGVGSLKEHLIKLAKELYVEQKVRFIGCVPIKELVRIYNFCDIFVLPSFVELEGMVVLEAMACAKPILVADSPDSASPFLIRNNGFLFNPKSPEDLACKTIKLLKNNRLRMTFSKESYKRSKEFDINCSVLKLEKAYFDIINS